MKKYYFVSYAKRFGNTHFLLDIKSTVIDVHPFEFNKKLDYNHTLITWVEISETEYNQYK